ncbi:MAG: TlpA family protein disulfide reductase [Planctomycetales bacterium]|nr:TlpA family protein disulfide reductase [Planctomycetales bacterium]
MCIPRMQFHAKLDACCPGRRDTNHWSATSPNRTGWLVILSALAMLTGCDDGTPPDSYYVDDSLTSQVSLLEVGREEYDQLLAQLRGDVVLVDFWATWCGPCAEKFPHTMDLHRRFASQGLRVVTVSCDEPDDMSSIRQFLAAQGAFDVDNLVSKFGGGQETFEAFEIDDLIPHIKLYDRRGRLKYSFDADTRELELRVEELLAQSASDVYSDELELTPEQRRLLDEISRDDGP